MALYKKREQALAAGEFEYYSGKPCPVGHIANRYAVDGKCVICSDLDLKRRINEAKLKGTK